MTTTVGWRWIFIINVPLGVIAALIALRVLTPARDAPRRLDRLGLLLSTISIFALIAGIEIVTEASAIALLLSGVFRSIGFTAYATIQFADMPSNLLESANTLSATVQQLAAALGIAIASTVLVITQHAIRSDGLLAYRITFLVMALIAAIAVAGSVSLRAGAADHLRRRPV